MEEVEDPPNPSSQGDTRAACPGDKRACVSEAGHTRAALPGAVRASASEAEGPAAFADQPVPLPFTSP